MDNFLFLTETEAWNSIQIFSKRDRFWMIDNCNNISKDIQEMIQSRSTAPSRHHRKEGSGTNNYKTDAT